MRTLLKCLCLLTGVLAGCTSFAPSGGLIGQDRTAVIADMGPPSRERQLPSGSRLEYPRGPFGKSTYFVFLDASGKVIGGGFKYEVQHVLTKRETPRWVS